MGACLSAAKVSGSNSNTTASAAAATTTTTTTVVNQHRKESAKPSSTTTTNKEGGLRNRQQTPRQQQPRNPQQLRPREKANSRRQSGVIPYGKRTDFGYAKDFNKRYTIGKLLGHGQFGYTYVATDKANGDRVAVKRIEKNKMILPIAVEDVKREVKILEALAGHENVVHFHNAFEDENYVFIVTE